MNLYYQEFSRLKTINCFGCQYQRDSLNEHDCWTTRFDQFFQIEAIENVRHLLHPTTYQHIRELIDSGFDPIVHGGETNAAF